MSAENIAPSRSRGTEPFPRLFHGAARDLIWRNLKGVDVMDIGPNKNTYPTGIEQVFVRLCYYSIECRNTVKIFAMQYEHQTRLSCSPSLRFFDIGFM